VCACKYISVSRPQHRHSGGGRPGGGSGWHGVFRSVAAFPPPRKQRRRKRHPLQRVSLSPPPPSVSLSLSVSLQYHLLFIPPPLPFARAPFLLYLSFLSMSLSLSLSLFFISLSLPLALPTSVFFSRLPAEMLFFFHLFTLFLYPPSLSIQQNVNRSFHSKWNAQRSCDYFKKYH